MSRGGRLQVQRHDGSWEDRQLLGYRDSKKNTAIAVAESGRRPVRIVAKDGTILFQYTP